MEKEHRLSFLREPEPGFAWAAHAWARGKPLEAGAGHDLTPGDFVRAVKQLIDLLGQIAVAAGPGSPLAVHRARRRGRAAPRRGRLLVGGVASGKTRWLKLRA